MCEFDLNKIMRSQRMATMRAATTAFPSHVQSPDCANYLKDFKLPPSRMNPIEGVNSAFRRRTKTQASFTNEDSALVLLYGLFAMGQITLRKIDGWKDLKEVQLPGLQHAA